MSFVPQDLVVKRKRGTDMFTPLNRGPEITMCNDTNK